MSKYFAFALLALYAEARFSQEQVPVSAISALGTFGKPGEAATLAGGVPGSLLAAANPCDKLTLADKIVSTLGTDPAVIKAAAGLVAAEQNFNPFNVAIPSICGDATLPATKELRGIVPLVDPAVVGSDVQNANSAKSLTTPFDATGLSVADVMKAQGFSNFTVKGGANAAAAPAVGNANSATGNQNAGVKGGNNSTQQSTGQTGMMNGDKKGGKGGKGGGQQNNGQTGKATAANTNSCSRKPKKGSQNGGSNNNGAATKGTPNGNAASATNTQSQNSTQSQNPNQNQGTQKGSATAASGAADFGQCKPTMDFQLGRPGRKATEGTFLPTDPLVAKGQQDALNPNIITNRICDQLTNVCNANQAAKDACLSAKAKVASLGTKDQSTADAFNKALGF